MKPMSEERLNYAIAIEEAIAALKDKADGLLANGTEDRHRSYASELRKHAKTIAALSPPAQEAQAEPTREQCDKWLLARAMNEAHAETKVMLYAILRELRAPRAVLTDEQRGALERAIDHFDSLAEKRESWAQRNDLDGQPDSMLDEVNDARKQAFEYRTRAAILRSLIAQGRRS